ncbi:MAG: hypothetical protein QOF48_1739 [Verrucomicrobiota bacterium]|jgi:hypothetical protein
MGFFLRNGQSKPLNPMNPSIKFSGRVYVLRGLQLRGQHVPAKSVIACTDAEFRLLREGGRAEEFNPENPVHAKAAAAPAPASPPSVPKAARRGLVGLLFILAILSLFTPTAARAQYVPPVTRWSAITNTGTWTMPASNGATVAVNAPLTQFPWVIVGSSGFGLGIMAYATNAAHTTNTWFTLETSVDGVNAVTNNNLTVCYLPTGVATNTYFTNFQTTLANLGNISAVRVKNFMSTNGAVGGSLAGNLFVQKILITTR